MVCVCCHTPESQQKSGTHRYDILVAGPEHVRWKVLGSAESFLFFSYLPDQLVHPVFIKVHVSDGGKKPLHHQFICFRLRGIILCCSCKANQCAGQFILTVGNNCALAANSRFRTCLAARGLFTLKTKHTAHSILPFHFKSYVQVISRMAGWIPELPVASDPDQSVKSALSCIQSYYNGSTLLLRQVHCSIIHVLNL